MITIEKVQMYKRFRGDLDGFARSREPGSKMGDEDWYLIAEFLSALHIVGAGLASDKFAEALEQKLSQQVEDERARNELQKLSKTKDIS